MVMMMMMMVTMTMLVMMMLLLLCMMMMMMVVVVVVVVIFSGGFTGMNCMAGGKVCLRARWPIRPALNSGFCSMKRLGILLRPPGWDASPSQGYPPALYRRYPFYTPGLRETMWNKVSCLRKQHDGSDQARTTDRQIGSPMR